ncbi:hypothetical protein FBEOM_7136 [Fusarium beomiforme]|uniref:Uncharacterized protein n=1 Tax=Fusarium beomiforme TaxID=44412 RepID=A0A9P5AHP6_9HYPO|nr:hypothetical protein FBEOM_7136 [Fusarium beomiforme]
MAKLVDGKVRNGRRFDDEGEDGDENFGGEIGENAEFSVAPTECLVFTAEDGREMRQILPNLPCRATDWNPHGGGAGPRSPLLMM